MKKNMLYLALVYLCISCVNSSKKNQDTQLNQAKTETSQNPLEQSITRGKDVYLNFCNQCHRPKGTGVGKSYPPLAGSDWLSKKRMESIKAIKFGLKGEILVNGETYNNVMTPLGLSNQEIADVMNYTMNTWGNTQDKMVTQQEVEAVKK